MIFFISALLTEMLVWIVAPGTSASLLNLLGIPLDMVVLIIASSVILFVRRYILIPRSAYLFSILLLLNIPALFLFTIPIMFNVKLLIISFAFVIGYNDNEVSTKTAQIGFILFLINVVVKRSYEIPHPSYLHFFNTNEAIFIMVFVLLKLPRKNSSNKFYFLVSLFLTKSRSAIVAALLTFIKARRLVFILLPLLLVLFLFSPNAFGRFLLITEDIGCFGSECTNPSGRIKLVLTGLEVFKANVMFGLTAEYHDQLNTIWRGNLVYSPHFGPVVLLWGYGVYGLVVFSLFFIKFYKISKLHSGARALFIFGSVVFLFNDFILSYLFWILLGNLLRFKNEVGAMRPLDKRTPDEASSATIK